MFCSQCGTKLPDGSAFCSQCGASTQQGMPTAAPVAEPQPAAQQFAAAPKKMPQINAAEVLDRVKPHLILVTTVVSLLLILFGILNTLNKPFYKIPAISVVMTFAGVADDAEAELLDPLEEAIDEMEDDLDYQEEWMDDDEVEAAEAVIESMEKLHARFSINNFRKFTDLVEDVNNDFDTGYDEDEIDEIQMILNTVVIVVWCCFILPVLFTVLGGLKKSAVLTIIGMVFTALAQLNVCGILWVILSLAVGIYRVMLCKQAKAAALETAI